jgi:hypothetical protein
MHENTPDSGACGSEDFEAQPGRRAERRQVLVSDDFSGIVSTQSSHFEEAACPRFGMPYSLLRQPSAFVRWFPPLTVFLNGGAKT